MHNHSKIDIKGVNLMCIPDDHHDHNLDYAAVVSLPSRTVVQFSQISLHPTGFRAFSKLLISFYED